MNDVIDICRIEGEIQIDDKNIYDPGVDVVQLTRKSWNGFSKTQSFSKKYLRKCMLMVLKFMELRN